MPKVFKRLNPVVEAEFILVLGILIDIFIKPSALSANSGISYFGTYLDTLPAYAIAISTSSYLITRFALFNIHSHKALQNMIVSLLPFSLLLIIFPYNVNRYYSDIHQLFGILIFVFQLLISLIILIKFKQKSWNFLLFSLEFISGLTAAYYLSPKTGFLIQSQIVYQIAFGIMLIINKTQLSENLVV